MIPRTGRRSIGVQIMLSEQAHRTLEQLSTTTGHSRSEIVRQAIQLLNVVLAPDQISDVEVTAFTQALMGARASLRGGV